MIAGRELGGATPAIEAEVIDPIGAGDGFAAGVLVGLLEEDLEQGIAYGTAMVALKVGLEGDQF